MRYPTRPTRALIFPQLCRTEGNRTMNKTIARISISISIALALSTTAAFAQSSPPTTYTKQTLTLDAANTAVVASLAKSRELGVLSVVAVYDEGGTLKALSTMDGARFTGVQFALDKAWTAARRQAATQDLADANAIGPDMNWHSFLKQPQTTLLGGGLPIIVNGQVVGGIGSSGGTIAQDTEIVTAGLAAIQR
jgi:uncharacterized protein GlcG (DUF336 family)